MNGEALASRCALALLLWLACSAVLLHKHHGKFQNVRLYDMLAAFSVSSAKGLWQIRLSAGVAMALLIGELAGLPRGVWVGYACMSVLLPFGEAGTSLPMRALQRIGGVVVGSLLYAGFSLVVPAGSRILFGPIAGICMGFPSKYMVNNSLNCFGALLLAESVYGVSGSVTLRIYDNMIGVLFAVCCTVLFSLLERRASSDEAPATNRTKPSTNI